MTRPFGRLALGTGLASLLAACALTDVPDPSTIVLELTAVLGIGLGRLRRFRHKLPE